MKPHERASCLGGLFALPLVVAAHFAPRACEITGGVLLLLAAVWAGAKVARQPSAAQSVRVAWLAALFGTTGAVLLAYGSLTAAAFAIAFVGTSVLAVVAFVLYLLLGDV